MYASSLYYSIFNQKYQLFFSLYDHKRLWYIMDASMVFEKLRSKQKAAHSDDYVVALDIGTEFVKALIAKLDGEELQIVGVGRARQDISDMHSGAIADISGV